MKHQYLVLAFKFALIKLIIDLPILFFGLDANRLCELCLFDHLSS
uniref:Uncharacterized protein n=1 Tax=Arundo donax TaxID=35708 RepID=A0A0A9BF92_ARUDO